MGEMRYGVPYQGSKNKIADFVTAYIPKCEHFYDLFAGGCAITHKAMIDHKAEVYHANDINDTPQLFKDAIGGKFKDEKRWISREDFFALKDADPYVRICWSFGNNCLEYLYSKEVEPWKKALWYARVYGDESLLRDMGIFSGYSRIAVSQNSEEYKRKYIAWYKKNYSESLQSLQSLERLQSLEITQGDYRELFIEPNSFIYCDIPYKGTNGYNQKAFDHEAFYNWVRNNDNIILISEYSMPSDFVCVASVLKRQLYSSTNNSKLVSENLYVHQSKVDKYYRMLGWRERSLFDDSAI